MKISTNTTLTLTVTIGLAASLIGLGGCSSDDTASSTKSTTTADAPAITSKPATTPEASSTTTAATEPTAAAAEQHPAITAAIGFWDRYIEITGRSGPFDPTATRTELAEFTTGAETAKLFDFVQANAATGRVLNGTMTHSPRLAAVDPTSATVEDCLLDQTGVYNPDGSRVDNVDERPHLATMGLKLDSATWKVETVSIATEVCEP